MSEQPVIFADQLHEMDVAFGVARLRLSQVGAGGALVPAGTLVLPAEQLGPLAEALNSLVRQLEEQGSDEAGAG